MLKLINKSQLQFNFSLCRCNKRLETVFRIQSKYVQQVLLTATGGTITTCGNFKIHTFTGPGTFTVCVQVIHQDQIQ